MKKVFIISSFIFTFAITANAQLKVDSIGNVAIGTNNSFFRPKLSVGDFGLSNSFKGMGIVVKQDAIANAKNTAVHGYVLSSLSTGSNFGVLGSAQLCGYHGRNYGVTGMVAYDPYSQYLGGAGIYALDNSYTYSLGPDNLQGIYAAYLHGTTYLNGQTLSQEIYTPADSQLREEVESVETRDGGSQTLDNLLRMNVLEFKMKGTQKLKTPDELDMEVTDDLRAAYEYAKKKEDAVYSRRHYGLSAQELKEIYPSLVLEGQDGYLYVNYTELVPLLIRSIQELKQELDEVKGNGDAVRKMPQADNINTNEAAGKSTLYQNIPNPFKEKTVIRFKLADNVKDASICIFDMSGKLLKKLPVSHGMESVSVNGYELGEGMFLYSLVINGQEIDTKRMILSK